MLIAALLMLCVAVPACADDGIPDYYEYELITDENGVTTARLTDFIGDAEVVVMPSYVDGYMVTEVSRALYDTQDDFLKELTWAGTVPVVPYEMFDCFTALETVVLSEGVTKSDYGAFSNCTSLTSVSLPSTLTFIGYHAFYNCSALTSISIPDSVEFIGYRAFYGCSAMTSATIGTGVTGWDRGYTFENCTSLTDVTLKQGLTSLGDRMFSDSGVEKLIVPSSITSYSSYSFSGMEDTLKELEIYIDTIPYEAFNNFTVLETVVLGEGVTKIDHYDYTYYGHGAFYNCTSLTSVSLPSTLTFIGHNAFYNCSALTSISIPDSVEFIGYKAFYGCSAMTSATIGTGVTGWDRGYTFENCTSLTNVTLKQGLTSLGDRMFSDSGVEKLIVPSSITSYSSYSFSGMEDTLKELEIYIDTIPYEAFNNFTVLETVVLGEGVTKIDYNSSSWNSVYCGAFYNCTSLTSVSLPSTLTSIGYYAFYNCSALTSISIPDSVEFIGYWAFYGCSAMTSATIGTGVTGWDRGCTFENCTSLTDVTLKQGLTTLGNSMFDNCSALTRVYLPSSITSYGRYAFRSSTTLIIPGNTTTAATLTAAGREYVPPTTLALPADLAAIEAEAFLGDAAEMVVIPASCTAIGSRAFADMPNLHYVQLPSGTVVAPDAFDGSLVLEFIEY